MHGLGRSSAAVTIVNALPTGVGCALGVRLYAAAEVDLEPSPEPLLRVEPEPAGTPLVFRSLEAAFAAAADGRTFAVRLRVTSEIPAGKGLKSSSAVSTAVIQAVHNALGVSISAEVTARLAAGAGRAAGVSATGAFDDAMAGLVPGFVVTDNRDDRVLSVALPDPAWTAVVHVPGGVHPLSPTVRERFRGTGPEGKVAVDAVLRGAWPEAMERNTRLVERVMGYAYDELRARLARAGARASGVSGMGPALVSLVDSARSDGVLRSMPPERFVVPVASTEHP